MIIKRKECIDNMNAILMFALIIYLALNMLAIIVSADFKEWFEEFREYNVCEFILLFTLFLPTTILFALFWILSIKPFKK